MPLHGRVRAYCSSAAINEAIVGRMPSAKEVRHYWLPSGLGLRADVLIWGQFLRFMFNLLGSLDLQMKSLLADR
jgi:hypothetical protein